MEEALSFADAPLGKLFTFMLAKWKPSQRHHFPSLLNWVHGDAKIRVLNEDVEAADHEDFLRSQAVLATARSSEGESVLLYTYAHTFESWPHSASRWKQLFAVEDNRKESEKSGLFIRVKEKKIPEKKKNRV